MTYEEIIFDGGTSSISRALFGYVDHKVEEKEVERIVTIDACKKKIRGSRIIQDFKRYTCGLIHLKNNCFK